MDHLRRGGRDCRIRHDVLATRRAGIVDHERRADHGVEHDDVLRVPCLSDRGVSDLDPRPRRRPRLFHEPGQRDLLRLHRRLCAARGRRRRRVRPDHISHDHRDRVDRGLGPERAWQAARRLSNTPALAEAARHLYLSRGLFPGRGWTAMLDAAVKALSQILSPPMRSILWRSIGLALVLITALAVGLQRLLSWFAVYGEDWAEAMLGPGFHTSLNVLAWIVSIAAGLGVVLGGIFLMPAITSLVASVFVDEVADHVEQEHYPAEQPGTALPLGLAMQEGIKTALLTILVYLIALPFVFLAGAGFLAFFIATAWLLGREYFELAAMRFRPPAEAKAMRRAHRGQVFLAGMFIVLFVSVPILNFATPLFAMALMVHIHKRASGRRAGAIVARSWTL